MRLTTKTRYGVRAMFDLAYHASSHAAQAGDIAERQAIPLRFLEQIIADLRRAGLVDSRRGPRGGYRLRRPPAEIGLTQIVTALQGPLDELFADEVREEGEARRGITADLWRDLAAHVSAWFDGVTLADLVRRAEAQGLPRASAAATPRPMYFI